MANINPDTLTPFGKLALQLDHDFSELDRLSAQIERLEIESDSGLELATRLLAQFAKHGQGVAEGIQEFAKALETSRAGAERSAAIVGERAIAIQQRQSEQLHLQEKFQELGAKVQEASASIATLKSADEAEQKAQIPGRLREMEERLGAFAEEAKAIKDQARQIHFRRIEREAESLFGTLQSARTKIGASLSSLH